MGQIFCRQHVLRYLFTISLFFITSVFNAQTLKRNFYFGNESEKGIEKVVEVLRGDTNMFHGQYLHFFQNGTLRIEGVFRFNVPIGLWNYYYESGLLKHTVSYRNDSLSYWKYFYENGSSKKEGLVKNHLKDSLWTYYYENGKVLKKGEYQNDLQNAQWNYYYEDGEAKAVAMYHLGTGNYTEYYYKGGIKMKGAVQEDETNGIWNYYYESGKIKATGLEQNGVKNGKWAYYFDNDTLASTGTFINGAKQGEWKFYHSNGILSSEGLINEGLRDGYWKLFNENGGFKADANLINGTGSYKEYYHNNKLKVNGYLKSDKNHGKWTYYYEDGTLEGEAQFIDGVGNYKEYYQSGEMKMAGIIKDGKQVGTWELYDKDGTVIGYYKLIPIGEDGNMTKQELPSTDNDPPVLPNDTISAHKMPRYAVQHRSKYKPFTAKYGESKGLIVSANPIAIVANQVPVSIEYFIQERLGYELRYTIKRSPFFISDKKIIDSVLYQRGFSIDLKQKFYSKFTQERGMLYFAHEVLYSLDNAFVKSDNQSVLNKLKEQKIEYAITFGDRVLHDIRSGGLTFDVYLGLGGAVVFQKWNIAEGVKSKFLSFENDKLELRPRGGFSLGYLF